MHHHRDITAIADRTSLCDLQISRRQNARGGAFDWDGTMARALLGDAVAYRALLTETSRWLHRFYARKLPADMIDDVVQETLMAVHTRRATFTPGRPYLPWLATIARYKWVDVIRSSKRRHAEELGEVPTPGHEAEVLSEISLRALLGSLKAAQAEVIRMVKLEGRSVKEAADLSGQSESLVKVNIHRGILAMRCMLGGSDPAIA